MTREEAIDIIRKNIPHLGIGANEMTEALNELVPELRESEDEEIRKDIIGGLMWQRDNLKSEGPHDNNLILPGFCFTVGKHLTYLEKQKEPKPDIELKQVTEEQLHNLNEAIKGLRMDGCERMADSLHSLYNILTKEKKPAWSEEDEKMLKSIIGDLFCGTDFNMELKFTASKKVNWLKDKLKSPSLQPKAE